MSDTFYENVYKAVLIEKIKEVTVNFLKDLEVSQTNKAAARRARVASLELDKLYKAFRGRKVNK